MNSIFVGYSEGPGTRNEAGYLELTGLGFNLGLTHEASDSGDRVEINFQGWLPVKNGFLQ